MKYKAGFCFILLFLTIFSLNCFAQKLPQVNKIVIVSEVGNSIPDDTGKIVKYEDKIKLYAVIKSGKKWYLGYKNSSLPNKIKINGKIYSIKEGSLERWNELSWGKIKIKWYKIIPRMAPSRPFGGYKWYSNVFSEEGGEEGKWRGWQIIEYEQYPLAEEGWSITPEKEIGTVRFRAEVIFNGKVVSSPGRPDPTHPSGISAKDYDKGIKDTVHRISRLSNHPNKLIRYIEALRKVPWLWGAEYRDTPKNTPSSHQADLSNPVGIDCASLVISALRAMGNKKLKYVSAKDLIKGIYTHPIGDWKTLTFKKITLFENWTPRGITWGKEGVFYIFGEKKIQLRDKRFNLIKEIKIKDPSFELLDIKVADNGKIYSVLQEGLERKVAIIDGEGKIKELFIPKIRKSIKLKGEEYSCMVEINPSGIEVNSFLENSEQKIKIYLFASDTIYVFDSKGERIDSISLDKKISRNWSPVGFFSLEKKLFYIPVDDKKILIYNFKGKLLKEIKLDESILDIDVKDQRIAVLSFFPLKVQLYNIEGKFLWDYTDRFLNEKGEVMRIKIGSSSESLHIGDLILTTSPTYHTLLLYKDNGNGLFDSKDEVICAGHKGVEIRKASYFEGREFVLRRVEEKIKTSP